MSIKSRKLPDHEYRSHPESILSIPWIEWKDSEINNEKWMIPKNGPDGYFLDMQHVPMPSSLEPYKWIRAHHLQNLSEPLTVFATTVEFPDLISTNKHLMHSKFVRWFVSTLIDVQYCGRNGLEIKGESDDFVWNGHRQCWQGWMHVYSNSKAGRGTQHHPTINANGKYIIRLYFMGCWRRVVVDDMIPVDKGGKPLLPTTANNFELWPMLLAKALLKIASLTWTQQHEIVDFHFIACLTGWVCLSLNIAHLSPQDKWDFVTKYVEHFEWAPSTTEDEAIEYTKTKPTAKEVKLKASSKKPQTPIKSQPIALFLELEDMREISSDEVLGISPCWDHLIYVIQSRDIPLDPKDVKPSLARWKQYRWLNWAIEENLIDPAEYLVPIRYLNLVSPLRKCKESVVYVYDEINEKEDTVQEEKRIFSSNKSMKQNKSQDTTTASSSKKLKEETSEDINLWGDFNKICKYVNQVHLFYKQDYFQYTLRMSDSLFEKATNVDRREESVSKESKKDRKKGSGKSVSSEIEYAKESKFVNIYTWPNVMTKSRNEPLYLFCDSLDSKYFLINFCSMQVQLSRTNSMKNIDEIHNSAISFKLSNKSYFLMEYHSWFFRQTHSEPLVSISTAGTKSAMIELEPGRHLFRMFCRSESCCFISISSDTIFHVGDRFKMHQLMSVESERMNVIAKRISHSANKAYLAFGTQDYSVALKQYYRSYMPDLVNLTKRNDKAFFKQIHEYFIEEKVEAIKKIFPSEVMPELLSSLRTFFLDYKIGREQPRTISLIFKSFRESKSLLLVPYPVPSESRSIKNDTLKIINENNSKDFNQSATIIQSFFKMVIVKRYKMRHDPKHTDHEKIRKNLSKIADILDYTRLLRNVIKRNEKLYDLYPCSKDFQYVLQVQESAGVLTNVKPNRWIPIVRIVVNSQEPEVVFSAVELLVNLPNYTLRVFNNENCREIQRIINNVIPSRYRYNEVGYTIFGYGWTENQKFKELDWTLHAITMKGDPIFHYLDKQEPVSLSTKLPSLTIEESCDPYIPNVKNLISRWIVKITATTILSLRLTTSYDQVKLNLKVTDRKNNVLTEIDGNYTVILPLVYLKHDAFEIQPILEKQIENGKDNEKEMDNSHGIYYIEAFVLNDSWPLTETEWNVVHETKKKAASSFEKSKFSITSSSKASRSDLTKTRRGSKHSIEISQQLEAPYCILQAIVDADNTFEIHRDKRREMEIASIKESWWVDDPERLQRGRRLKNEFIEKHALVISASFMAGPKTSISPSGHVIAKKDTERESSVSNWSVQSRSTEIRTLKPPRSYHAYLPALDMSIHIKKQDELDDHWVKTEAEEDILRSHRMMHILDTQNNHKRFLEEMSELLTKQKRTYETLLDDYNDRFSQRRAQLDEVYELRKLCVDKTKSTSTVTKSKSKKKRLKG